MSTLRAGLSCPNRRRICRSARRSLPACATHACRAIGRVIGEVGLAGEIRAVSQAERRLAECARLGFTTAVIPRENARHLRAPEGMRVYSVETLAEALAILFG